MNPNQCRNLIQWFKKHTHKITVGSKEDYWAIQKFHIFNPVVRDTLNQVEFDVVSEIFAKTGARMYPTMTNINQWHIGGMQTPHYDTYSSEEVDAGILNEELEFPNREWTVILNLNEDFSGGQTYFPDRDMEQITPQVGKAVIFQGIYHLHGVHKVYQNQRYTISSWFSGDPNLMLSNRMTQQLDLKYTDLKNISF